MADTSDRDKVKPITSETGGVLGFIHTGSGPITGISAAVSPTSSLKRKSHNIKRNRRSHEAKGASASQAAASSSVKSSESGDGKICYLCDLCYLRICTELSSHGNW